MAVRLSAIDAACWLLGGRRWSSIGTRYLLSLKPAAFTQPFALCATICSIIGGVQYDSRIAHPPTGSDFALPHRRLGICTIFHTQFGLFFLYWRFCMIYRTQRTDFSFSFGFCTIYHTHCSKSPSDWKFCTIFHTNCAHRAILPPVCTIFRSHYFSRAIRTPASVRYFVYTEFPRPRRRQAPAPTAFDRG